MGEFQQVCMTCLDVAECVLARSTAWSVSLGKIARQRSVVGCRGIHWGKKLTGTLEQRSSFPKHKKTVG